jgi:demethylspheroidene O-methyltransferase
VRPDGASCQPAPAGLAQPRAGSTPAAGLDRLLVLRDRVLVSPRFQRWAADFPLTRWIARRRARALFDLCAGFVYSQILLACVQLNLFDILAEGPCTDTDLARRLSLPGDAAARLLRAAASLRLIERRSGRRFGLGNLGAALLGNPAVAAMIEHHRLLYADLADPVALLRGARETELSRYWPYASNDGAAGSELSRIAPYTALMAASQALIAQDILDAYPVQRHRCLLDVGGGDGAFVAAAATRAPALRLLCFDLPAVAEQAARRFVAAGLVDRVQAIGGNFLSDPLPRDADLISLVRVVHDNDDAAALALLRAVRLALPRDGVVMIAEPMAGTRGAEPVGDAYFGLYLFAMGRGHPRKPYEIMRLLMAAGFDRPRLAPTRTPLLVRVVTARRTDDK